MGNPYWDTYGKATDAFAQGQLTAQRQHQQAQADADRQTAQAAGAQFAQGNWTGGAGTLFQGGDLANGQAALTFQQQNQDRALKIASEQDAARKAALADQVSVSLAGLRALQAAPAEQRGQLFDQSIAPVLAQRGLAQAGIDHIRSIAGNDDALKAEEAALGEAATKYGFVNLNGDLVRTDTSTGTATTAYRGHREPKYQNTGQGQTSTLIDPGTPGGPVDPNAPEQPQAQAPTPQTPAPQAGSVTPAAPQTPAFTRIGQYAAQAGATPQDTGYLQRTAQIESGGRPGAVNGSSQGVFQFHPDTFYGVLPNGNINSPADQTKAALLLAQRDRQALQQHGVTPDDANTYIMHQQGAGGGVALLTAPPEVGAVAALEPVYGSPARALAAIAGNIGMPYKTPAQRQAANAVAQQMTTGEFVSFWRQRWSGAGGGPAPVGATAQGTPPAPASGAPGGFQPPAVIRGAPKEQPAPSGYRWAAGGALEPIPGGPADPGESALTPQAIESIAQKYELMGNAGLPPLGTGKAGARNRALVQNRAAEMELATGTSGADAVARWAQMKAESRELNDATIQRGRMQVAENTAAANADLMLSLAPKGGGQTNVPVLNRWLQAGRKQLAGDPDVTRFDIAIGTFADEYAKVVSGATGQQGSTDSSRKEAYDRLSKYAAQGQLAAGVETMKQEMANRTASQQARVDAAISSFHSGGGSHAAPDQGHAGFRVGPDGVHTYPVFTPEQYSAAIRNPANHGKHFYDTNGNLMAIP